MTTIDKPIVKVVCSSSGNDWSDYITHFKYEDCTDKANMLEIRFSDDYALRAIDSPDFRKGSELKIQWGYTGGVLSNVHRVIVQDIDAKYTKSVDATIRCLDKTKDMNSSCRTFIWENITSSGIAKKIAERYGLSVVVDETSKVWTSIPQSNETDFNFLKSLADKEKDGNFESFVRGGTLYFRKRPVDKKATWTVQFGDDDFIEFTPRSRNTTKSTSDDGVKLLGVDSFGKSVDIDMIGKTSLTDQTSLGVDSKTDRKSVPDDRKTSKKAIRKVMYDVNGNEIKRIESVDEDNVTTVGAGGMSEDEKSNLGNSIVKSGQDNGNTGSLTLIGNPLMEAGTIVTVKRVANYHAGNWMIKKVQTLIDRSGYKTVLDLTRSMASITGANDGSAKVNTTEGEKTSQTGGKVSIRKYDVDGNELK